jgi:hypothetical protein
MKGSIPLVEVQECKKSWIITEIRKKRFSTELDNKIVEISNPPQVVATRICDSLRQRSVLAMYNNCEAICKTSGYSRYGIYLYAGEDDGETKTTLVEIIRLDGCPFTFHNEREAVIHAARHGNGNGNIDDNDDHNTVHESRKHRLVVPDDMMMNYAPPPKEEYMNTLLRMTNLLNSNGKGNQNLFILRNLASITTIDSISRTSATQITELILKDNCHGIRDVLFRLLNDVKPEANEITCQMQNRCLGIFSNCFTIASEEKILGNIPDWNDFAQAMVVSLIDIISKCYCPHSTTIALRCLSLLLKNSPAACDTMNKEYIMNVKRAESIGEQRHSKLEQEAKSTLDALNYL